MNRPKIVVVGSSNTDMVIKLERLPKPGETILGGDFMMVTGGKGANQAVAAARLGGDVTLVARVGADVFGRQALENFKKESINTDFIVMDNKNSSGVALILVDQNGENSIAVASGANNYLSKQDVLAAREVIEQADVMLLQLEIPMETVLFSAKLAQKAGVRVVLNPAPARRLEKELLKLVSVLTPNESETELLTGIKVTDESSALEAARKLQEQGVSNLIITMGPRGSILVQKKKALNIPTKKVEAVDTTAAGDAFNGALAYALAQKKCLEESAQFANRAGALSATRMGAQPSMPTIEELQRFADT